MSNTVKKKFRDKFTKEVYKKGDAYKHEDDERVDFLVEKGYLNKSKQSEQKNTKKKADKK